MITPRLLVNLTIPLFYLSGLLILVPAACSEKEEVTEKEVVKTEYPGYTDFKSYSHFLETLTTLSNIPDPILRNSHLNSFVDSITKHNRIPFVLGDSVAFIYRGAASNVSWPGDFNGWNPNNSGFQGKQVGISNIWLMEQVFPSDARLDYKIFIDGNWILDPLNKNSQWGGAGPNSELRMPGWVLPAETIKKPETGKGSLSQNYYINSSSPNLGYQVQYKVYTPYGYDRLSNLKTIYVTDGHEYADERLGSMINVLDNLIHNKQIEPVIAIFIDPRNPGNLAQNRRMTEYAANQKFANFVADELVPAIDQGWKSNPDPSTRAILGTSMGGWNSAWFGFYRSDVFRNIAIHSPAFNQAMIDSYSNTPKLPLKIYMATGVIYDTQVKARAMRSAMEAKGYPLLYREVNEGHSWGSWRGLIDEPLILFYGTE